MVDRNTNILVAVQNYPVIAEIFAKHGLGCIGCMIAHAETLGEGIEGHGLNADEIIAEINEAIANK